MDRRSKISPTRNKTVKTGQELADLVQAEKDKKSAAESKAKDEERELREAINQVAATDAGRVLLRFVLELSGHEKHKGVVNPQSGELNVQSSGYNLGRDSLWLTLKSKIQPKYLKLILFP